MEQFYSNKKILIIGLAKSGESIAHFLLKSGAHITITAPDNEDNRNCRNQLNSYENTRIILGPHPFELLEEEFDFIIKNPGISYSVPFIQKALSMNKKIITELDIVYPVSKTKHTIAITGSNGKTTTTTLIDNILEAHHLNSVACGNIGYPISKALMEQPDDTNLVMELSSFQLKSVYDFRPNISVLINLSPSHLDYHETFEDYMWSKANITKNQSQDDCFIYNYDDRHVKTIAENSPALKIPFSASSYLETGACVWNDTFYYNGTPLFDISETRVPGTHNLENYLVAIAVAKTMDIPTPTIKESFNHFFGVTHRMQYVGEHQGIKFYNDSKATNVIASSNAINSFEENSTILIAGGLDRGNDFIDYLPSLRKCKSVFLIGETATKIYEVAKSNGLNHVHISAHLEKAVTDAYQHSSYGDNILLSPACASWDQYSTFEQRGNEFIQFTKNLKGLS